MNRIRQALILAILLLSAVGAHADDGAIRGDEPPPELTDEILAELGTSSPRGAVYQFISAARRGDYEAASEHLNLRNLPPAVAALGAGPLARRLHIVLDQTLWIEWESLSENATGFLDDGMARSQDLVGKIETQAGPQSILVEQATWAGGKPVWKVANESVALIPALYGEFGYGPFGEYLPPVLLENSFLDVRLWQWLALLVVAALAYLVGRLFAALLTLLARPLVARSRTDLDDRLVELAQAPVRVLLFAALLSAALPSLGLALPVHRFMAGVAKTILAVGGVWLITRLIDMASELIQEQLVARGQAIAMSVVPLGRRTAKVLLSALAILVILQNFGVNVTGLIAGLGIGGLAFALAAQKTIENLFGGITLIADRPVAVGDFCRYGDKVGTVEEVGLRSTRIRTLGRTVVTVPNAEFSSMQIENFARRDRIWFNTVIGVRYETSADQLRYLLVELKKLLVAHPKVHPDPARARFVGFGASSLDIEIYAYIMTSDWAEFLAIREDLLLRIIDCVEGAGSGFAFPSQTVYTTPDGGLDAGRSKAAEDAVAQLRETGDLGLPNYRTDQLTAMANQLEYPGEGAAERQA